MNDATPIDTAVAAVRLGDLTLSALNTRQTVADADVAALAESIKAAGLLQNLSVLDHDDQIGVVAGGKRLRALQLLADQGAADVTLDTLVPVKITTDPGIARLWATAENEARQDPHPADQIAAYRDMWHAGSDPATIARAFAKTKAHVEGRLALAQIPDTALTALRRGEINLDEAKALTLASDQAQAERVLEEALQHPTRHGNYIRRELAEGRIPATDRRAVFIGLDVYQAEGGAMTLDLFEGQSLLHNEALLDKLFAHKLALETERVEQEEGWSWAKPLQNTYVSADDTKGLLRIYPVQGEMSESDLQDLHNLTELEGNDALHTASVSDPAGMLADLRRRKEGDFTDGQRTAGGVFVYVDRTGSLAVARAYIRGKKTGAPATGDDTVETVRTSPKPPITQKGIEDLNTITTLALQTALVGKTEFLLDLFAFQLEADFLSPWSAPLNIKVDPQRIQGSTQNGITTDARLTATSDAASGDLTAQFVAFKALGKKHRNDVLARHLARSINCPMMSDFGKDLFVAAGANMRAVWTPTAEGFFMSCSVPMMESLFCDLADLDGDDEGFVNFAKLKKAEKAKELERLFTDASVQEALLLSREQIKAIDTWVPAEFQINNP